MAVNFPGSWLTPRSIILRGGWVSGVLYSREIFVKNLINFAKSYQNRKHFDPLFSGPGRFQWWKKLEVESLIGMTLKIGSGKVTWLPPPAVWYCRDIDSAQYDTPKSQNLHQNRKYVNPSASGPGRFQWWKNRGKKSRWTVPFSKWINCKNDLPNGCYVRIHGAFLFWKKNIRIFKLNFF